jgi:hypothetical protein
MSFSSLVGRAGRLLPLIALMLLVGRAGRLLPLIALMLLVGMGTGFAADGNFSVVNSQFSAGAAQSNAAGSTMIGTVGNTVSSIAAIITGPVLYIIMGVAIMVSVFGFVSGKMVMAFSGVGAFILAAVLKALFALVFA